MKTAKPDAKGASMITDYPPTIGLLLAGGQSSRMGGGDKPLLQIGHVPILDRIIDRMKDQCSELLLNANGDPERFANYDMIIIRDDIDGFKGPLAGILAGMDWTARNRPEIGWIASIATDTPFIPRTLVGSLHDQILRSGSRLACAGSGGWTHPVIGLWPVMLREDLRQALTQEGLRKIDAWTARYGVTVHEWPIVQFDPFFNANTPEDIIEAENLVAAGVID
jgi:molybdenum cofactor guanylyltransferase